MRSALPLTPADTKCPVCFPGLDISRFHTAGTVFGRPFSPPSLNGFVAHVPPELQNPLFDGVKLGQNVCTTVSAHLQISALYWTWDECGNSALANVANLHACCFTDDEMDPFQCCHMAVAMHLQRTLVGWY